MPSTLSPAVRIIGIIVVMLCLAYIGQRLWRQFDQLPPGLIAQIWPGLLAATGVYFLAGCLLAPVWWLALRLAGERAAGPLPSVAIHLSSQIGKYLPGNVAHFAARHVLSRRTGVGHSTLIAATLTEALVLIAVAGALCLWIFDQLLGHWGAFSFSRIGMAVVPVLALGLLTVGLVLTRRAGWRASAGGAGLQSARAGSAVLLAVGFFALSALSFTLMTDSLHTGDWPVVLPWLAAAWLAGYVVPGAPGGLGVRELVLMLGLTPLVGEAPAALYAVAFRVVTVAGDGLLSLTGLCVLRCLHRSKTGLGHDAIKS